MKTQDKHILTIKTLYPNATNVYKPATPGFVHDVYIVEDNDKKFVCRFSDKATAEHNLYVSKLFQTYNINAPRVSLYKANNQYCETYPFIEGKTFHERLIEGMPTENQGKVYKQLLEMSFKIAEIQNYTIPPLAESLTVSLSKKIFKILNPNSSVLSHTDLHAKNVILDESDNVRAIIDLDAVSPEPLIFTLVVLARDTYIYGFDSNKLVEMYGNRKEPNRLSPKAQIKIYAFLRNIYKGLSTDFIRKQLLKIHIK